MTWFEIEHKVLVRGGLAGRGARVRCPTPGSCPGRWWTTSSAAATGPTGWRPSASRWPRPRARATSRALAHASRGLGIACSRTGHDDEAYRALRGRARAVPGTRRRRGRGPCPPGHLLAAGPAGAARGSPAPRRDRPAPLPGGGPPARPGQRAQRHRLAQRGARELPDHAGPLPPGPGTAARARQPARSGRRPGQSRLRPFPAGGARQGGEPLPAVGCRPSGSSRTVPTRPRC